MMYDGLCLGFNVGVGLVAADSENLTKLENSSSSSLYNIFNNLEPKLKNIQSSGRISNLAGEESVFDIMSDVGGVMPWILHGNWFRYR